MKEPHGGEKRGSGIGGTFPNQAWLELACEEIGAIVDWEIKSFGYIGPKLPTRLCERGSVSLGHTCRKRPCEGFLVYIWRQIF